MTSIGPAVGAAALLVAALVVLLAEGVYAGNCPDASGLRDLYDPQKHSADCLDDCYDAYCSCTGNRMYDVVFKECTGPIPGTVDCNVMTTCVRSYTICVALASFNQSQPAGCSSWSKNMKALVQGFASDASAPNFSSTILYKACTEYTCLMTQNASSVDCSPLPWLECPAPLPNNFATSWTPAPWAPAPTTTEGSPAVQTTRVEGTLSIPGEFSNFFASVGTTGMGSPQFVAMLQAVQQSLGNLFGFPVTVANLTQGSLIAAFNVVVPSSSWGSVQAVLGSAVITPQSSWLSSVQSQYALYYPNTPLSSAVALSYSSSTVPASTPIPNSPVAPSSTNPCDSGCVAGIVIGAAVALIILVGCLVSWCRRKPQGAAYQKPGTTEETTGVAYSPRESDQQEMQNIATGQSPQHLVNRQSARQVLPPQQQPGVYQAQRQQMPQPGHLAPAPLRPVAALPPPPQQAPRPAQAAPHSTAAESAAAPIQQQQALQPAVAQTADTPQAVSEPAWPTTAGDVSQQHIVEQVESPPTTAAVSIHEV